MGVERLSVEGLSAERLEAAQAITGLSLEDAAVGRRWRSQDRTIVAADVEEFAGLSGYQEGGWHVPALLGLCIGSGLLANPVTHLDLVQAVLQIRWGASLPIEVGDRVHARAEILDRVPLAGGQSNLVQLGMELVNQHDQVVQGAVLTLLVRGEGG